MNPDNPSVLPSVLTAALRSVLMAAGASLVTAGAMTGAQESDLVGAVLVIGAFAWSQVQKLEANRRLGAAIRAPASPPLPGQESHGGAA